MMATSRRDVIPIREAQKAVWELWEFVWQALRDPDGSHTTHFAIAALIKERAIEIKDKLATPHDGEGSILCTGVSADSCRAALAAEGMMSVND